MLGEKLLLLLAASSGVFSAQSPVPAMGAAPSSDMKVALIVDHATSDCVIVRGTLEMLPYPGMEVCLGDTVRVEAPNSFIHLSSLSFGISDVCLSYGSPMRPRPADLIISSLTDSDMRGSESDGQRGQSLTVDLVQGRLDVVDSVLNYYRVMQKSRFTVSTSSIRTAAKGTKYWLNYELNQLRVTCDEGQVLVHESDTKETELGPKQTKVFTTQRPPKP